MEDQPELLTVKTLIKDLADFDQNAEIAVCMHGIPVTLPIGFITKANASKDDETAKNYVLMIIAPKSVQDALEFAKTLEPANETAQLN